MKNRRVFFSGAILGALVAVILSPLALVSQPPPAQPTTGTVMADTTTGALRGPSNFFSGNAVPAISDASVTNSSGTTTLTAASGISTQNLTLSGSAGMRSIVVATTNVLPGSKCDILFTIPATSGIAVTVYSGSTSGPVIQTFTTTGAAQITSALLTLEFSGSNWQGVFYQGPMP